MAHNDLNPEIYFSDHSNPHWIIIEYRIIYVLSDVNLNTYQALWFMDSLDIGITVERPI